MTPPILGIFASAVTGGLSVTSFESIATVTVGSGGAADVEFTSIPGTYKHLQVRAFHKSTTSGDYDFSFQFNSDTGSNYTKHQIGGNGSDAYSTGTANTTQIPGGFMQLAQVGGTVIDILEYANTSIYKTARVLTGSDTNGGGNVGLRSGQWRDTSAITSIKFTPTSGASAFAQYSHFALYGIKGA